MSLYYYGEAFLPRLNLNELQEPLVTDIHTGMAAQVGFKTEILQGVTMLLAIYMEAFFYWQYRSRKQHSICFQVNVLSQMNV